LTRAQLKSTRKVRLQQFPGTVAPLKQLKRKPLKRITIHAVNQRDQGQCTHVSRIGRCEQKRWLDRHHIVPVSNGGTNEIENLTTLCHAHHKLMHRPLLNAERHNRADR
jgi:hypothetical protein